MAKIAACKSLCLQNSISYGFVHQVRKKMLLPNNRIQRLKEICSGISTRYCFEFDSIGTDGDHVHIFIGSEPKYAPSRVMQIIESINS